MADEEQNRQEAARRAARGVLAERERREQEAFARAIQAALAYGVEPRGEK